MLETSTCSTSVRCRSQAISLCAAAASKREPTTVAARCGKRQLYNHHQLPAQREYSNLSRACCMHFPTSRQHINLRTLWFGNSTLPSASVSRVQNQGNVLLVNVCIRLHKIVC